MIRAGTYRLKSLLHSGGESGWDAKGIEFYFTEQLYVDEAFVQYIKENTGFDVAVGNYDILYKGSEINVSCSTTNYYEVWVDYGIPTIVSVTPSIPDELIALLQPTAVDIVYDAGGIGDNPDPTANYWEEGRNIITFTKDQEALIWAEWWFMDNVDAKLTRLYSGDVAYSSNGKRFRKLATEEPISTLAGLYDANDNLVASWDTLVNTYGMDCEKDYTFLSDEPNYVVTATSSPLYIIKHNSELINGVKLFIDDSVKEIGEYAFVDFKHLTSVSIPDTVLKLEDMAFDGCEGLTNLTLGNSITWIGAYAFRDCKSLGSITIPKFVTQIRTGAFQNCASLESINYRGTMEQWNAIVKGAMWNYKVPATYVQCTDGQATL